MRMEFPQHASSADSPRLLLSAISTRLSQAHMKITIKNMDFFSDILKIFREKDRLTFEIDTENFKMSLLHMNSYYANLEMSLFAVEDPEEISFTVDPKLMLKYLHFFRAGLSIEVDRFLVLRSMESQASTEIRVPLNELESYGYTFLEPSTKALLKNIGFLKTFTGMTTYETRDGCLVLTKVLNEAKDVLVIEDVEWLQAQDLYFTCNNDWVSSLETLSDRIESVLMEFSPYILSVKFLFKNFTKSYLEIQVPKCISTHPSF